jgi:hypothetical protein
MSFGSILAADFGSAHTRVVLFDVVDGEYRLVARGETPTTFGTPVDDVSVGLRRVLRDFEQAMGRRFLDREGRIITPETPDRSGVDTFVMTSSAGRPLRAVVVALLKDVSLRSALSALSTSYIEPTATLTIDDMRDEEAHVNTILSARPDVLFIVGGTEGGASEPLARFIRAIRTALNAQEERARPAVIYAGNTRYAPYVERAIGDLVQVRLAPNVRPSLQDELIEGAQLELGSIYDSAKERSGEGFERVSDLSETGILPTAQSYTLMAEYVAALERANVLAVDVGSASSVLVGVFNGKPNTRINPLKGMGQSATTLLTAVGADAVKAWLPFYAHAHELEAYALNKTLRPHTVPMTLRELYIEHALLRASMRDMVQNARRLWDGVPERGALPPIKAILAGGATLTKSGTPFFDMLLIADCLQPSGVTDVYSDPHGILPALGALAQHHPEATVQLMEANNLDYLGALISVEGNIAYDKPIGKLKVKINGEAVGGEARLMGGHLLSIATPSGVTLELDIRLARGFSIGGKRRLKQTFEGGKAGVLFDGRGRQFTPPADVEARAKWMPLWLYEATELELQAIPQEWLVKPEEAMPAPAKAEKPAKPVKEAKKPAKASKDAKKPASKDEDFDALLNADDDDEDFSALLRDDTQSKKDERDDMLKGLF